jgi:putative DNA primase/helicase
MIGNKDNGFAAIPAELRNRTQWVGFRMTPNADGKPKKAPVVADSPSQAAICTDSSTWRTFDATVKGYERGDYHAIAYALQLDIVGIDLDGPRWMNDGTPTQEALDLIKRCASYVERSISNNGIHILLRGQIPAGRRNSRANLEIYTESRFLICTGQCLPDSPAVIVNNQEAIDWVFETYFNSTQEPTETTELTEHMTSVDSGISLSLNAPFSLSMT